MANKFPTQRSISQVIRRHTPGSLMYIEEDDIIARVRRVKGEKDTNVDLARLHTQVVRFLNGREGKDGYLVGLAPDIEARDLVAIAPESVTWEPYPHIYRCVDDKCQVLHDGTAKDFTGKCRRCGNALRQLPYVYYHRCGRPDYLKPPAHAACPTHGRAYLYFHDTRRFSTSSWRCRECKHEQRFLFPYCNQPQCRDQEPKEPRLQGSFWNDQWVHYCQTLDYINLDEPLAKRFLSTARGKRILHQGVLGTILAGSRRVLHTLQDEGQACPNCGQTIPHGNRFCGNCGNPVPEGLFSDAVAVGGREYPMSSDSGRCALALLRDLEASRSLRDEATRAAESGDPEENPYQWGLRYAELAGIFDVVLVTDFPLTTAAIGYTRHRSGPPSWFRAFERIDDRIPIYTRSVSGEAWLVQLQATAIARWLIKNEVEPFATALRAITHEEEVLKEWFIQRLAQIEVAGAEATPDDLRLLEILFALLHSFSHVTLLSLAVHSGLDATSLGELVLTDALAFAVYAGGSDLGALSAAFEQLAGIIFTSVAEDYASCKFDPECRTDDGGACVGCIHLYRGCQAFNTQLSRAYLFSGNTGDEGMGSVQNGYFATARALI